MGKGDSMRMAKRSFLLKHGIVRNAIRKDLLYFALPAILVWVGGLYVTDRDGYDDLWSNLWNVIR
jgi:hypothetical protein